VRCDWLSGRAETALNEGGAGRSEFRVATTPPAGHEGAAALGVLDPARYDAWFELPLGRRVWCDERHALRRVLGDVAGRRVLDAGCGTGRLACELAQHGALVAGVDRSAAMLEFARAHSRAGGNASVAGDARTGGNARAVGCASAGGNASRGGMAGSGEWVRGDVACLPFTDGAFDLVAAVTVLCLAPDAGAVVRELARVTRPGGRVVLGELGRWSLWAGVRRLRARLSGGTWTGARFWTVRELETLLRQAGLEPAGRAAAVFYPPWPPAARLAPPAIRLSERLMAGAAFLAVAGLAGLDRAGRPAEREASRVPR
jgi:SAM-dependent methyltransferase